MRAIDSFKVDKEAFSVMSSLLSIFSSVDVLLVIDS